MKVIEIGVSEQNEIFEIVASVLHLGNAKFVQNEKGFAEILSHDANTGNVSEVSISWFGSHDLHLEVPNLLLLICHGFVS